MSKLEYWELCPEGFVHALDSAKHAPFLMHYGRIRTFDDWVIAGFEIGYDKAGQITQRKGRNLHRFARVLAPGPTEQEAIVTGKRNVDHFFPLLDYARAGVAFDEFVSHPAHYQDFCLAALALEKGDIDAAISGFKKALEGDPNEVRYAEKYFSLRVSRGDVLAPAEELAYFSNEVDSMIHTGRVYEWIGLLLSDGRVAEAAAVLRQTAHLMEEKIAGHLPKGRYSGETSSFVAYKRDQFRKKLESWALMRKYKTLMNEVDSQGGLPQKTNPQS